MKLRKSKATKILCVALALLAFTLTACSSAVPRGLKKEPEQGGGQESRREDERGQEEDGLAGGEDGKKQATEEVRNPGQDDAVRDGESYERGTVNGNVYESKCLGIRLSLSDDYVVATQEEFEQAREVGADLIMSEEAQEKYGEVAASVAIEPELMAVCVSDGGRMNISIAVQKLPLANMTADQFFMLSKQGMSGGLADGMEMNFGDTSEVEIAGTTYTKMPITTAVQGISANIDMYMRVKDGHAALITITYLPEQSAKVEELIGSIQKY